MVGPMSGPQRARLALLAALVVVAAALLWQLTSPPRGPAAWDAGEGQVPTTPARKPPPPMLVGSGGVDRAGRSLEDAGAPEADTASAPADAGARAPQGAVLGPLFPLDPGAVDDRVAADARVPIVLPRAYVVGRIGPYGVREDPGSTRAPDWSGMARLERGERAPSEAEDDTKEPVTTAVRGVVRDADGDPIVGAEVILYSSFYLRQAYYDHRVRQIGRVLTDADGVFDMRPIDLDTVHFGADGDVLVSVRHPHHPDIIAQPLPGIVPGRESDVGDLVLPARAARVFGVITDLEGRPVQGAFVRASGALNPADYDKTERMVVLGACPTAITDAQGRYDLGGFAGGLHEISIHVRIDCVAHARGIWTGEREWSLRVLVGNGIRGRVIDPTGAPVAAAVVSAGVNWTPTNSDGTFWLDNIPAGPLTVEVAHHLWRTVFVRGVPTRSEGTAIDLEIALEERLPRLTLDVVDEREKPVALVAIDWVWPQGPGRFAPDSRFWHDPRGVFELVVPEGSAGALVSTPDGSRKSPLASDACTDGASVRIALAPP